MVSWVGSPFKEVAVGVHTIFVLFFFFHRKRQWNEVCDLIEVRTGKLQTTRKNFSITALLNYISLAWMRIYQPNQFVCLCSSLADGWAVEVGIVIYSILVPLCTFSCFPYFCLLSFFFPLLCMLFYFSLLLSLVLCLLSESIHYSNFLCFNDFFC